MVQLVLYTFLLRRYRQPLLRLSPSGLFKMRYQLIAFDAYGTLFDVYSVGTLAEKLFPGQGKALSLLWRDKQLEYTRLISLADPNPLGSQHYQSFWDLTIAALHFSCAQLKLDLSPEKESILLKQYAQLDSFPESAAVLEKIKTTGIKTCVLSNGNHQMLSWANQSSRLDQFLDRVISIEEARQFKITPSSYQLVLNHYPIPKDQILFVSCNAWDIIGANWFGFDTYWVNRYQLPFEKIGHAPTYIGSDLDGLIACLGPTPLASQ
jgi:2-haloacid dehalogenase